MDVKSRPRKRIDFQGIKESARGRWPAILVAIGMDSSLLDGDHHSCPKCPPSDGATNIDRFNVDRQSFRDTGRVFCNQCCTKGTSDGIDTVRWYLGLSPIEAAELVSDCIGLSTPSRSIDNSLPQAPSQSQFNLPSCPNCNGRDFWKAKQSDPKKQEDSPWLCENCSPPAVKSLIADRCGPLAAREAMERESKYQEDLNKFQIVADWKKIPIEDFLSLNPTITTRKFKILGSQPIEVCRIPMYEFAGKKPQQCGYFDLTIGHVHEALDKGMAGPKRHSRTGGFLCHDALGSPILPQPGSLVLVVEGPKKVAKARSLGFQHVVGLPGNHFHSHMIAQGSDFREIFRGCNVVMIPDLDKPSFEGFKKVAESLKAFAATIKQANLPGEIRESHGDDLGDVMVSKGPEVAREAIKNAQEIQSHSEGADLRTRQDVVIYDDDEAGSIDRLLKCLGSIGWDEDTENAQWRVYVQDSELKYVSDDLRTATLDEHMVGYILSKRHKFLKARSATDPDPIQCSLPRSIRLSIISKSRFHFPGVKKLTSVTDAPTVLVNGRMLKPGYDEETGIIYQPNPNLNIAISEDPPTQKEAVEAAKKLLAPFSEFPFLSSDDRSRFLASILTVAFKRTTLNTLTPMFAFLANSPGGGKTYMVQAAHIIALGKKAEVSTLPKSQEEQRKVFFASCKSRMPSLFFDNVKSKLDGDAIEGFLTASTYSSRELFTNEINGYPVSAVVFTTANGPAFSSDISRRAICIRLSVELERNLDFKIKEFLETISSNRAEYYGYLLTIMRAWLSSYRQHTGKTLRTYEQWSRLVCGAVMYAGMPDPLEISTDRDNCIDIDSDRSVNENLVVGLGLLGAQDFRNSKRSREIIDWYNTQRTAKDEYGRQIDNPLYDACEEFFFDSRHSNTAVFSQKIRPFVGRPTRFGVIRAKHRGQNQLAYWIENFKEPNEPDFTEEKSAQSVALQPIAEPQVTEIGSTVPALWHQGNPPWIQRGDLSICNGVNSQSKEICGGVLKYESLTSDNYMDHQCTKCGQIVPIKKSTYEQTFG